MRRGRQESNRIRGQDPRNEEYIDNGSSVSLRDVSAIRKGKETRYRRVQKHQDVRAGAQELGRNEAADVEIGKRKGKETAEGGRKHAEENAS